MRPAGKPDDVSDNARGGEHETDLAEEVEREAYKRHHAFPI